MEIPDSQKRFIEEFHNLLTYGSQKMSKFGLVWSKYRQKKKTLFLMMCAHQSYCEAIFKLMTNPPVYDKAAEVLYRSLSENLINIQYIYSDRSYKNGRRFLANSVQDQIDFAEKHRYFMTKYPKWNLKFGPYEKPTDWDSFISKKKAEADRILKRYGLRHSSPFPDIRDRAAIADRYLQKMKRLKENMSMEKYYILYYKFFSQVSHLTFPGLERFYSRSKDGKEKVIVDGDIESIDRMLTLTYQIYFVVLRFCLKEFGLFSKLELSPFNKISKSIA